MEEQPARGFRERHVAWQRHVIVGDFMFSEFDRYGHPGVDCMTGPSTGNLGLFLISFGATCP
jgi:hypothetical protein